MLKTRLPTASVPFSLNALANNLPAATSSSQRRETASAGSARKARSLSSTNQKCVRKIWATIGSACATSMIAENSCRTENPGTAQVGRQPQRAEAGALECDDLIEGVLVVEVSVLGAGGDLAEQSIEGVGAG